MDDAPLVEAFDRVESETFRRDVMLRLRDMSKRGGRVMRSFCASPCDENGVPRLARATGAPFTRLRLTRPTREVRAQQLRKLVVEFCELRFDEVDPCEQMALTQRMLAFLCSLDDDLTYWEFEERWDERAFTLLGVAEDSVRDIQDMIVAARENLESRNYRAVYDALCAARPRLELRQVATAPGPLPPRLLPRSAPASDEALAVQVPPTLAHFDEYLPPAFLELRRAFSTEHSAEHVAEAAARGVLAEESSSEHSGEDGSAEVQGLSLADPITFETDFVEKACKLESTDTRMAKRRELPIGEFIITILPKRLSQKKNCSAFKATKGICSIQLKKVSGQAGEVDLSVRLGRDLSRIVHVKHDFYANPVCIIPEMLDLRRGIDRRSNTFCLKFGFGIGMVPN